MPRVTVEMLKGRTREQKSAVIRGITEALVEGFGVSPSVVSVRIAETEPQNMAVGGVLCSDGAEGCGLRIMAIYMGGRTDEQRRTAAARMIEKVAAAVDVGAENVHVYFRAIVKEEMARNGVLNCDR